MLRRRTGEVQWERVSFAGTTGDRAKGYGIPGQFVAVASAYRVAADKAPRTRRSAAKFSPFRSGMIDAENPCEGRHFATTS